MTSDRQFASSWLAEQMNEPLCVAPKTEVVISGSSFNRPRDSLAPWTLWHADPLYWSSACRAPSLSYFNAGTSPSCGHTRTRTQTRGHGDRRVAGWRRGTFKANAPIARGGDATPTQQSNNGVCRKNTHYRQRLGGIWNNKIEKKKKKRDRD